jgi:hypothetical protein
MRFAFNRGGEEVIMKKKIIIFAILLSLSFIGLPTDGLSSTKRADTMITTGILGPQINIRIGQPRRKRGGYGRNGRGYRNGQNRGNIARNRRYRLVPQYYWDDGRRRVRYVRVYNN